MKKMMMAAAAFSVLALTASTCFAQEVEFTGQEAPIPVFHALPVGEEEEPEVVNLAKVDVLGLADGYAVVAYTKEESNAGSTDDTEQESSEASAAESEAESTQEAAEETAPETQNSETVIGYVPLESILEIIPSLDYEALPEVSAWKDQGQGANGDYVLEAQKALILLGALDGSADGKFGPATGGAISSFQQENGFNPTGVLDLLTYCSILEKAQGNEAIEAPYPPEYKAEDKFADILADLQDTDVLEAFVTPNFKYFFDAFDGDGLIFTDTVLGKYEDTSRPIDTISIAVAPNMKVKREDNGVISVTPVFRVVSIGAYRPYVKSLILKAGNTVKEMEVSEVSGQLLDTQVTETADLEMNVEDIKDLLGKGDLEVRLKGNSREYDLDVSAGAEDILEAVGQ